METIKKIGIAIYQSKAVRTSLKGLGIAIAVVVAEYLGFGTNVITLLQGL